MRAESLIEKEKDLAYRVLRLEQQLESYQKLHTEKLKDILTMLIIGSRCRR